MNKDDFERFRGELEAELKENILPWWMKYTPDPVYGGFHGHVSHSNVPIENAPKGAIMNTRILWTFAAAYSIYSESSYLEMADRAFHYLRKHFLDKELGGVYWEVDFTGKVSASRKQIYALAYTLYAMTEYHMACGDRDALETAVALFHNIEEYALDSQKGGYTEALSREWKPVEDMRLSEKDDNEKKTMNTHLHILEAYASLYRIWKDSRLESALEKIIQLFLDRFVDLRTLHLNLFFDDNWTLKSNLISYGHDIECTWLLHEAAEILGKPELVKKTGELAVKMARENLQALDRDGGLFYEFFPSENRLDTDKHWWPQAEAVVGYFNAYQLSGEQEFAIKARGSWEFIKKYLVDSNYGEWYWSVNREGIPQTAKEKAGFWKCPYHNGRACMEIINRIKPMNL